MSVLFVDQPLFEAESSIAVPSAGSLPLRRRGYRPSTSLRKHARVRSDYLSQLRLPLSPSILVDEFHRSFGLTRTATPTLELSEGLPQLRLALIQEEADELADAIASRDLVGVADALGDIVYVTFGAAIAFGIDLDGVLAEIHRSNMTKLGADGRPVLRQDGKVMKGPKYTPPDLKSVLASQAADPLPFK